MKKKYIIISIIVAIFIILGIIGVLSIERIQEKKVIDQDEASYTDYQSLNYPNYHDKPDRILYKPKEKDKFYIFDSEDKEFEHVLKVAEDRLSYTYVENPSAFQMDSMDRILSSGQNYIILDFTEQTKLKNNKRVICKIKDSNRLKRLLNYLCRYRKSYAPNKIPQKSFEIEKEKTEDGYRKIQTVDDLNKIVSNLTGKYRLMNDIDFEGTSFCINNHFSGELDGNGYALKNIKIEDKDLENIEKVERGGIIQSNSGVIKNIKIEQVEINLTNQNMLLFGTLVGNNTGTIEECTVSGNIYVKGASTSGICGISSEGIIRNCISQVNIKDGIAGICGYVEQTTIENCQNEGKIEGEYVAGIVMSSSGNIEGCINSGELVAIGDAYGIIGYAKIIQNCKNVGNITSKKGKAAGIIGTNNGQVKNCINTGNILGCGAVGGIASINGDPNEKMGVIRQCKNTGVITIQDGYSNSSYLGGIVGNHVLGDIVECDNEGNLVDNSRHITAKGKIAGAKSSRATIDIEKSWGKYYNFQEYYQEHAMETLDD